MNGRPSEDHIPKHHLISQSVSKAKKKQGRKSERENRGKREKIGEKQNFLLKIIFS
jgi:hypothetical protein